MNSPRSVTHAWLCVLQPTEDIHQAWLPVAQVMPSDHAVSELLAGRQAIVYGRDINLVLTRYRNGLEYRERVVPGPAEFDPNMTGSQP